MRRCALLLSMLAALAGTPLRQAEAASDLARALADPTEAVGLATPDGGVGDDSGDVTLNAAHGHAAATDSLVLPPPASSTPTPAVLEGLRERVWWPQAPPGLRFAWLNVFRF